MSATVYFRVVPNEEWKRIKDTETEPFEGVRDMYSTEKYKTIHYWKDGAMYVECEEKKPK